MLNDYIVKFSIEQYKFYVITRVHSFYNVMTISHGWNYFLTQLCIKRNQNNNVTLQSMLTQAVVVSAPTSITERKSISFTKHQFRCGETVVVSLLRIRISVTAVVLL